MHLVFCCCRQPHGECPKTAGQDVNLKLACLHNLKCLVDSHFRQRYAETKATGSYSQVDGNWLITAVLWCISDSRERKRDIKEGSFLLHHQQQQQQQQHTAASRLDVVQVVQTLQLLFDWLSRRIDVVAFLVIIRKKRTIFLCDYLVSSHSQSVSQWVRQEDSRVQVPSYQFLLLQPAAGIHSNMPSRMGHLSRKW